MSESFSAWLQRQLDRREWSQADFARRAKVSTGLVSNWLAGERRPNPSSCDRIADVFLVDVDEVLAIAGHRPRLPQDRLDEIHAAFDPILRHLDPLDFEDVKTLVKVLVEQANDRRRTTHEAAIES